MGVVTDRLVFSDQDLERSTAASQAAICRTPTVRLYLFDDVVRFVNVSHRREKDNSALGIAR
ncbi:hypothetical protein EYF80_016145 [Liparis tanakae]|uniref:Uncharacterized protein n=1 Tax=Liparis tanakae TaxID=230148 RepID=A0A4Z2I6V2_9TELE|nr:hypothetical protein EYF80_016145 [Liparis tanakae]